MSVHTSKPNTVHVRFIRHDANDLSPDQEHWARRVHISMVTEVAAELRWLSPNCTNRIHKAILNYHNIALTPTSPSTMIGSIQSISAFFPNDKSNPALENDFEPRPLGRVVALEEPYQEEENLARNEELLKSLGKDDYVEIIYGLSS